MPDPLRPDAYAAARGNRCPACGGRALGYGRLAPGGRTRVTRRASCSTCGASWAAVYDLTGYDDLTILEDRDGA